MHHYCFKSDICLSSASLCLWMCQVRIWEIPDEGLRRNLTESVLELYGHSRRVGLIEWHPTTSGILFSAGYDYKVIKSFATVSNSIKWATTLKHGQCGQSDCMWKLILNVSSRLLWTWECHTATNTVSEVWLMCFLSLCRSWFGIWRLGSRWKWLTATQTWSSACHLTQRGACWPPAARTRSSASLSPALAKCCRCGLCAFSLTVYALRHS